MNMSYLSIKKCSCKLKYISMNFKGRLRRTSYPLQGWLSFKNGKRLVLVVYVNQPQVVLANATWNGFFKFSAVMIKWHRNNDLLNCFENNAPTQTLNYKKTWSFNIFY